jgi:phage shock protein A
MPFILTLAGGTFWHVLMKKKSTITQERRSDMTIMTRFMRLCRADIHGVMDQLEDKGLVLKQYLRDMEKELDLKEAGLKKMMASRDQMRREHQKYTLEGSKIEQDLTMAIEKNKDDIARALIKKVKPLNDHREELARHIETLGHEISQFEEGIQEQRLQYEQLQLRSSEYFRSLERRQWEQAMTSAVPQGVLREPSQEEIELELLQRKEAIKGGEEK